MTAHLLCCPAVGDHRADPHLQQVPDPEGTTPADAPVLKADISTSFPDADIFGVKLVNGRPTRALVEVVNHEDGPIQFAFVSGALASTQELPADAPAYQAILRNLSAVQYNLQIGAGETKALPFSFAVDMQPQDVTLQLMAVVANSKGNIFQIPAHTGPAAIVEPPTSLLDPQMYVTLVS